MNNRLNLQRPEDIVDDFSTFINFLDENSIKLTKTRQFLQGKVVYTLNQKMYLEQMENVTTRTPQHSFPLIHLFYHLALAGKLFEVNYRKSYNVLKPTENLSKYRNLTKTEKYLFLLETLWLDCDWHNLQAGTFGKRCENELEKLLKELLKYGPDKYVNVPDRTYLARLAFPLEYFLKYLSFFGLWRVKYDENAHVRLSSIRAYSAEGITLTKSGAKICPILLQYWPLEDYNLPYIRYQGEDFGIPGQRTAFDQPFWLPFINIFPEGELTVTIPREENIQLEGNYIFKISLQSSWRKAKISSSSSLEDLHLIIQKAFNFDNDHLYTFFPSGKVWQGENYSSPYDSSGFNAAEKKIMNLGLLPGQEILYIFDFGAEWRFRVKYENFVEEPQLLRPQVIDQKGESPEQYPW